MLQEPIVVVPPTTDGGTARIRVSGDLDITTVGALQADLDALLATHPILVEVDLSAVTFFSCTAAQALRAAHQRASGSLTVTGAGRATRRLMEIMQLGGLLAAENGHPGTARCPSSTTWATRDGGRLRATL